MITLSVSPEQLSSTVGTALQCRVTAHTALHSQRCQRQSGRALSLARGVGERRKGSGSSFVLGEPIAEAYISPFIAVLRLTHCSIERCLTTKPAGGSDRQDFGDCARHIQKCRLLNTGRNVTARVGPYHHFFWLLPRQSTAGSRPRWLKSCRF